MRNPSRILDVSVLGTDKAKICGKKQPAQTDQTDIKIFETSIWIRSLKPLCIPE